MNVKKEKTASGQSFGNPEKASNVAGLDCAGKPRPRPIQNSTKRPGAPIGCRGRSVNSDAPLDMVGGAGPVSRHRSDVVGCAQPSERSARRIACPYRAVLASDA